MIRGNPPVIIAKLKYYSLNLIYLKFDRDKFNKYYFTSFVAACLRTGSLDLSARERQWLLHNGTGSSIWHSVQPYIQARPLTPWDLLTQSHLGCQVSHPASNRKGSLELWRVETDRLFWFIAECLTVAETIARSSSVIEQAVTLVSFSLVRGLE